MMARSPVTSPLCTPYGICGRFRSGVTTAGAWAHADGRDSPTVRPPSPAADRTRKRRRFMAGLLVGASARPLLTEPECFHDDAEDVGVVEESTDSLGSWAHRGEDHVVARVHALVGAVRQVAHAEHRARHATVLVVGHVGLPGAFDRGDERTVGLGLEG